MVFKVSLTWRATALYLSFSASSCIKTLAFFPPVKDVGSFKPDLYRWGVKLSIRDLFAVALTGGDVSFRFAATCLTPLRTVPIVRFNPLVAVRVLGVLYREVLFWNGNPVATLLFDVLINPVLPGTYLVLT